MLAVGARNCLDVQLSVLSLKAVKVDRRDILAKRKDAAAAKVTFREAAIQYHAENEGCWKSKTYARQWLAALENYAFPKLGNATTGTIMEAEISPPLALPGRTSRKRRGRYATVYAPYSIMPMPRAGDQAKRLLAMGV